jgi:saccharopine dehydrogenase (NAD+, L-lysine-forming)
VGALPQHPTGQLGYAVNWSPEGLLRSYTAACDVLVNGKRHTVPALSDPEILRIGGVTYEAFTTSGGLGTMAETYEGHVETLDYKSMRYPGHLASMHLLLEELHFKEDLAGLVRRIRLALPPDDADWVLVHASAQGNQHGTLQTQALVMEYRPIEIGHRTRTAIAWTTAASLAAVVELVSTGNDRHESGARLGVRKTRVAAAQRVQTPGKPTCAAKPVPRIMASHRLPSHSGFGLRLGNGAGKRRLRVHRQDRQAR